MMFLNFFVWGIWFVTMGTFLSTQLGAGGVEIGLAYGTQSLGAIVAPFIIGLIADKYFAAQRILGILHLTGGFLLYYLSSQANFNTFYPYLLTYMIIYMPTLAFVNAIAFKQMASPEKEFSAIRVWGTIGWIASGLLIGWLALETTDSLDQTFKIAALVSLVLGVYSFMLPNTPPPKAGTKTSFSEIVGADAIGLLKDRNYLIFFMASLLICIPLAFYYQETNLFLNEVGVKNAASKMTMGQMSETIFLFLMPFFFSRLGVKKNAPDWNGCLGNSISLFWFWRCGQWSWSFICWNYFTWHLLRLLFCNRTDLYRPTSWRKNQIFCAGNDNACNLWSWNACRFLACRIDSGSI